MAFFRGPLLLAGMASGSETGEVGAECTSSGKAASLLQSQYQVNDSFSIDGANAMCACHEADSDGCGGRCDYKHSCTEDRCKNAGILEGLPYCHCHCHKIRPTCKHYDKDNDADLQKLVTCLDAGPLCEDPVAGPLVRAACCNTCGSCDGKKNDEEAATYSHGKVKTCSAASNMCSSEFKFSGAPMTVGEMMRKACPSTCNVPAAGKEDSLCAGHRPDGHGCGGKCSFKPSCKEARCEKEGFTKDDAYCHCNCHRIKKASKKPQDASDQKLRETITCSAIKSLCLDVNVGAKVQEACPKTCGLYPRYNDDEKALEEASGGKVSSCADAKGLCTHQMIGEMVQKVCPKTCKSKHWVFTPYTLASDFHYKGRQVGQGYCRPGSWTEKSHDSGWKNSVVKKFCVSNLWECQVKCVAGECSGFAFEDYADNCEKFCKTQTSKDADQCVKDTCMPKKRKECQNQNKLYCLTYHGKEKATKAGSVGALARNMRCYTSLYSTGD